VHFAQPLLLDDDQGALLLANMVSAALAYRNVYMESAVKDKL
jgi:hypothetical protein